MRKKRNLSAIAVFIIYIICGAPLAAQEEAPAINNKNLSSLLDQSVSYKVPPKFYPLRPGAIKPKGWLEDWAQSAADGITGHLDERHPVFGDGYKAIDIKAPGVKEQGTGWPLEQCAYWLDGLVRLAYILDDEYLIKKVSSRLDLIVDGVNNGGESLIYWRPRSDLNDEFNSWAHSHIARALVAYYQATGEKRILDALVKAYKNFPLSTLRMDVMGPTTGAVNLDPMLEVYSMSGNKNILENALAYSERDTFIILSGEWASGNAPNGHAVIFYENIRVPAILYPWTGNESYLEATERVLEVNNDRYGQPFGLVSAEEYMAGSGSTRYTETCNVACGIWTYNWLLRITGQGINADHIEKIFFNAGSVPISRDFQTLSYFQAPNRIEGLIPAEKSRGGDYIYTEIGHGPLCCVGNGNRIIPNYIMHMWMTTSDGGLASALYGPASVESIVGKNKTVRIETKTNYPFESKIQMTVRPSQKVLFPLYLRIPNWCKDPKIKLNGENIITEINKDGFVKIEREWVAGDQIILDFPMQAEIVRGRETNFPILRRNAFNWSDMYFYRPLSQRRDIDEPYAYINYGPLLFSLAIPDVTPDIQEADAEWNYALNINPEHLDTEIEVTHHGMPSHWHWQLDGAPIKLHVPARRFDWNPTGSHPLPKDFVKGGEPSIITLVPYCCTKFRITMFPVTEKTWGTK